MKSKALSTEVIVQGVKPIKQQNIEIRLAREARKVKETEAMRDIVVALIRDPALNILAAYILVEQLQKHGVVGGGLTGEFNEAVLMTAITTTVGLQAISPILPNLLLASSEALPSLVKGIGAMSALAAGG